MPQAMTEEEAVDKLCPFMSFQFPTPPEEENKGKLYCHGSRCACWGWVDGERGQMAEKPEYTHGDERPDGEGWNKVKGGFNGLETIWIRYPCIGPRRGQCAAMRPQVTVDFPS